MGAGKRVREWVCEGEGGTGVEGGMWVREYEWQWVRCGGGSQRCYATKRAQASKRCCATGNAVPYNDGQHINVEETDGKWSNRAWAGCKGVKGLPTACHLCTAGGSP